MLHRFPLQLLLSQPHANRFRQLVGLCVPWTKLRPPIRPEIHWCPWLAIIVSPFLGRP